MSIFKSNKFFRIIKHFILCLPLMFVLGSSLYAIVNPNAKDSYYGQTINEKEIISVSYDNLIYGNNYIFHNEIVAPIDDTNRTDLYVSNVVDLLGANDFSSVNRLYFFMYPDTNATSAIVYFYNNNNLVLSKVLSTSILEFSFDYVGIGSNVDIMQYFNYFYEIQYNEYSYLNNAFEYGMFQFTQIGFGQFDFISFFNGIFTTNLNNVYASFINDYINYYLFVELIYFAPWVFHMFIHFAYDLGDYFTSSFKRNRKEDD